MPILTVVVWLAMMICEKAEAGENARTGRARSRSDRGVNFIVQVESWARLRNEKWPARVLCELLIGTGTRRSPPTQYRGNLQAHQDENS